MSDLNLEEPSVTDMLRIMFMQLQRIYDLQLLLLRAQDPKAADYIDTVHSRFEFIGALPFDQEPTDE